MVASTITARLMRMPRLSRYSFTACNMAPPSSCFSSRWRNRKIVVSSGAGARPKSTCAKTPQRRRFILLLFRPRIAQIKPLLQKVHPRHDRKPTGGRLFSPFG
jgi:hypothetical protein